MSLDPSDPHDLRPPDEAAIETAHLAVSGLTEQDSVQKVVDILKGMDGVQRVQGEIGGTTVAVTFDARKTHAPALQDALLRGGYQPSPLPAA